MNLIDLHLADRLKEMSEEELGRHIVALLIAVKFEYNAFATAIDGQVRDIPGLYDTAMQLFAQSWKESGKSPSSDLKQEIFTWQVVLA